MSNVRLIARLDIKGSNVIKGIHLEGLRVVGNPQELSEKYYAAGIDEIIYMDSVASLYGRNSLKEIIQYTASRIFIPLTVGGAIRSVEDVSEALSFGADKVAVNTAAVRRPQLIYEISQKFGSQCMVLSIEAKKKTGGGWEAFTENGREHTGLDVLEWVRQGVDLGAGEILLTSVDQDGTSKGFDIELVHAVTTSVKVPVIASGGLGRPEHFAEAVHKGNADAVAMAHVLHYDKISIHDLKTAALSQNIAIRNDLLS